MGQCPEEIQLSLNLPQHLNAGDARRVCCLNGRAGGPLTVGSHEEQPRHGPFSRMLCRRSGRNSESRISNFRKGTESQLAAKARASEQSRQIAPRWRRDYALSYIAAAKALQVDRYLPRQ
jgi:hypothetical protein